MILQRVVAIAVRCADIVVAAVNAPNLGLENGMSMRRQTIASLSAQARTSSSVTSGQLHERRRRFSDSTLHAAFGACTGRRLRAVSRPRGFVRRAPYTRCGAFRNRHGTGPLLLAADGRAIGRRTWSRCTRSSGSILTENGPARHPHGAAAARSSGRANSRAFVRAPLRIARAVHAAGVDRVVLSSVRMSYRRRRFWSE